MADMMNTQSETEVEQQMYQAMAAQMQSEGMNVTAEEIAQTVEEQTSDNPPEPSEKDTEIMEQMAAYQAEHSQPTEAYVVRGALLHCQYGSHCRRMNLPLCHGVYTMKKPLVFKRDCKGGTEGADINIPTFGVCSCPGNPTGGSVCLEKEAPRNSDGSFTGEAASGTVTGTPCIPNIVGVWEDTHAETHIGKEGEEALTTRSFLVCSYGGLIEIIRSGQEDSDE